jgi:uncharacterized Zn finger protein
MVSGSEIYNIRVKITPVVRKHWTAICCDCADSIGSLVELLQGRLSKSVMERVCRKGDGLFPTPHEIKLSCSCPDWADMCKHVAAVMYAVGVRLDEKPELLFTLRDVDQSELIAKANNNVRLGGARPTTERVMVGDDLGALFGIDVGDEVAVAEPARVRKKAAVAAKKTPATSKAAKAKKPALVRSTAKAKSRKLKTKKSLSH